MVCFSLIHTSFYYYSFVTQTSISVRSSRFHCWVLFWATFAHFYGLLLFSVESLTEKKWRRVCYPSSSSPSLCCSSCLFPLLRCQVPSSSFLFFLTPFSSLSSVSIKIDSFSAPPPFFAFKMMSLFLGLSMLCDLCSLALVFSVCYCCYFFFWDHVGVLFL